ncbi:MAG TPA: hypothetical protein PLP29_04640 [Candidatus Ozemobacteraceae bacterium]|nr:hypothetical protein [Candidatus Ozemobacteraceae bacterium]
MFRSNKTATNSHFRQVASWNRPFAGNTPLLCSLLLAFLFGICAQGASAAVPTLNSGQLLLSTDLNSDGIAAIGDTVTAQFDLIATPALSGSSLSFTPVGGPVLPVALTLVNATTGQYNGTCNWTVTAGTADNSNLDPQYSFSNTSGNLAGSITGFKFDNKIPTRVSIMTVSPNPGKNGQTATFTQSVSGSDATGAIGNLDLSSIGKPASNLMTGNPLTVSTPLPPNLDSTFAFPITIRDARGNSSVYNDFSMPIDTKAPSIQATSKVTNNAGNIPAQPGHVIHFTVDLAEYDGDLVTVDLSPITLGSISLSQTSPATRFEGEYTLPQVDGIEGTNFPFTVYATDNGGNTSSRTVSLSAISLDPPDPQTTTVTILNSDSSVSAQAQLASISSILHFSSKIDSTLPASVSVNISALGVAAPLQMVGIFINGSATYEADYIIPAGSLENGPTYTFQVTAQDSGLNTIYRSTTPVIRIDSNPPTVSGVAVTRAAGAGTIRLGDSVTVSATVTGVESGAFAVGSVTADLRLFGATTSATSLTNVSGNLWQKVLTVSTGPVLIDDAVHAIRVVANDDLNNIASAESALLTIDTQPPVFQTAIWTRNPTDHPYVRIGDQLTFQVCGDLAPDTLTVKADLTSIGSVTPTLAKLSDNGLVATYALTFTVAQGPQDDGATLPIVITDDAGNIAYLPGLAQIAQPEMRIPLFDQLPPQPTGRLNLTAARIDPAGDAFPLTVINLNRSLAFGWPVESGGRDEGDCKIDLSLVGSGAADPMLWGAVPTASYGSFLTAASPGVLLDSSAYTFIATMTDKAGNTIATTTATSYVVDCIPPAIGSLSAEVVGGGIATIGSQILFKASVTGNDSLAPTVDLTGLGGAADQQLTSAGGSLYTWQATVPSGSWEATNASWLITISDSRGNKVSSFTAPIEIDNRPPQAGVLQVSWTDLLADGRISLGHAASFTIKLGAGDAPGTATIDLSAIGGAAAEQMTFANGSHSVSVPQTLAYTSEYTNYVFTARVTDKNGNVVTLTSSAIAEVDCLSPGFASCGILISQNNGDNPVSTVANAGDIVTVYASITNSLDMVATATISSGSVTLDTSLMTYVPARNRHEATFTIPAGSGIWDLSYVPLTFQATATDNVGNASWTSAALSAFKVKNKLPTIAAAAFTLSPNQSLFELSPDPVATYPVLNVGTGTIDKLTASASLALGDRVTSGILDLSLIPGAPAALALTVAGDSAGTASIDLSKYPLTDWTLATITLTLRDEAGNTVSTGTRLYVDTKRPAILGVTFDGTNLNVQFSEDYQEASLEASQWRLIGSMSSGLLASMSLTYDTTFSPSALVTDLDATLGLNAKTLIADWASTPLYLEVTSNATAPIKDFAGNWLPGYARFPITITDSTWRTPAKLTNFVVDTTNWNPASGIGTISLDLLFDRAMATDTLIASNAVLLVSPLGYDFLNIDYTAGYVFQKADMASSKWISDTQLHIELAETGRDWVARMLGSGTALLRFANRSPASVFVRDTLGKPATVYPTSAPFASSAIARPAAGSFIVLDPPGNITLNLASGTLDVVLSDRALLYTNGFYTFDGLDPALGIATPTYAKRTTRFHSKFVLYDTGADPATFTRLTLQPLATGTNSDVSSKTVHLRLTDADTANVIKMFRNNPAPVWGMRVDAGAFGNWWDQPSQLFLPSGNPGGMTLIPPATTGSARLAAAAISDPPRTKNAAAGTLFFEFDIEPHFIGNVPVPLSSAAPTARIASAAGETLATGTFVSWTTRTIAGKTRYTARFTNQTELLAPNIQDIDGHLEIWGVSDAFGQSLFTQASPGATDTVYDLNLRSTTDARGFSSGTSLLAIDTLPPTASITPTLVSRLGAGAGVFTVTFSERMNTTAGAPKLTLATGATTLNFTHRGWSADGRIATYSNDTAISDALVQGSWNYKLTAVGADLASNTFAGDTTQSANIRTNAPSVNSIQLSLTRGFLSPAPLVEQPQNLPFSQITPTGLTNGSGTVGILYADTPLNPPHTLRLINSSGASWTTGIDLTGVFGMATITAAVFGNPGNVGPASYLAQIFDAEGNTSDVATFVYDANAAALDLFDLSGAGIGSFVNGIYYTATTTAITARAHATNATDGQYLTVWPTTNGTDTFALTSSEMGTYTTVIASQFSGGDYLLGLSDMAGNLHTGIAPIRLRVDTTRPQVTAITPNGTVGNSLANAVTAVVTFDGPMNGAPASAPTLTLATSGYTIPFTFQSWTASNTAQYTNTNAIGSTYPAGTYTYQVAGGIDLAGNSASFTAGAFTLDVQSQGPAATPLVWTYQPLLSAQLFSGLSFNPNLPGGPGVATISLNYNGTPSNTPHDLLLVDSNGNYIATYTGITPVLGLASVTVTATLLDWAPAAVPSGNVGPLSYWLRLRDSAGNISADLPTSGPVPFVYDSLPATVTSVAFSGIQGIATGGYQYYSSLGNFTLTASTTIATDPQRLVIIDETSLATSVVLMTANNPVPNAHTVATGSGMAPGSYTFFFADLAGNIASGNAAITHVIVDNTAPQLASATPVSIGALAARAATFTLIFDEPMQTATTPTVLLATTGMSIALEPTPDAAGCWLSSTTCQFTNTAAVPSNLSPQGGYDYVVSNALDYAGNPAVSSLQISIYSKAPAATLDVRTHQPPLTGTQPLTNAPFSYPVSGAASLTFHYAAGPFNLPHELRMYNAGGIQVATYTVPANVDAEIPLSLDIASWTTAPGVAEATGPAVFTFRLVDGHGNLSADLLSSGGATASMTYDSKPASVTAFTFGDIGIASGGIRYYSPAVSGNTTITLTTDATDTQRLIITSGVATWITPLAQSSPAIHTIATGSGLAEGLYTFTAADPAGNFATGPACTQIVRVDASQPVVLEITPSTLTSGSPLHTMAAGAQIFTVRFSEPMNPDLATPTVTLTNGAYSTSLVASSTAGSCWISSDTCRFVNTQAIVATMPQGLYAYTVGGGRDYAGNPGVTRSDLQIEIQSRGPTVTAYTTRSRQYSTASGTEILINQPFSHLVGPNAATLTVTLATASGTDTFLHFIDAAGATIASVTLAWADPATVGTFTWDTATGPIPVTGSPYTLRLVDRFGNPALETGTWTMDATAPAVLATPDVFGGRTASGTTYTNSTLTFRFKAAEPLAPRLRVRSANATDTYAMTATSGTNLWSGAWNLYHSRDITLKATDGIYLADIVDAAGNVGTPTTGLATWSCRIVVDSAAPAVGTYTLKLAGVPVTRFSPAAASLTIEVTAPGTTLSETGIFWIDVTDRWSRLVKRLPLVATGTAFQAFWDGTTAAGALVNDDEYIFTATDYAGNRAAKTAKVFASTAGFRLLSAAEITSGTIDLRFSLPVRGASVQNADFAIPGLAVASFSLEEATRLRLTLNTGMTHGTDVPVTVNVGSITSDDFAPIAAPGNVATVTAVDARGPIVLDVLLAGLAGPNYFKAVFDEQVTETTAETVSNYALTTPGRTITLSNVTLLADGFSVTASASETLAENSEYTLTVTGVEDGYRNRSTAALASFTFWGADVTAPTITLAAFSNPGNERDILIAVKSSEALLNGGSPSLTVTPSTGSAVSVGMNLTQPLTWTAGYHLDANTGSVIISVSATDAAGNTATKNLTFTIATVNANIAARLISADGMMTAGFPRGSLKNTAFVKMLPHDLEQLATPTTALAGIRPHLSAAVRRSAASSVAKLASQASELVPVGRAYEISFAHAALGSGFDVTAKLPAGATRTGLALFRQADDQSWQALPGKIASGTIVSGGQAPGLFALLRDTRAPRFSITTKVSPDKPLTSARPKFEGHIEEYGSGLNLESVVARIDGESTQPVTVLEAGAIRFEPIEDLTGGAHEIVFESEDLAGNRTVLPAIRFAVQVPLAIQEISIYPNPARIRSTIRIGANRRDVDPDLIDVHIYDVAGHHVVKLSGVAAVREAAGASARYLYDVVWDLTNADDERVANGVYLAKIVIRDPDDPGRKVKKTHKIAVLR